MELELLEELRRWLLTAPGFAAEEEGGRVSAFYIDDSTPRPGQAGLFPQGVQELKRQENLLGEVTARCRCTFTLRLVLAAVPGDTALAAENAAFVLALQQWVAAQSAAHLAPHFGNAEQNRETLTATAGKAAERNDEGTVTYTVTLKAEYTQKYGSPA